MSNLPLGWVDTTLGELGTWTSGGTPSRTEASYYGGKFPWVKTGDLNDSVVTIVPESITQAGLENSSAKLIPQGSLLMAMYGATIGKLGLLGQQAATNQACAALLPYGQTADLIPFLFYRLLSKRNQFRQIGKGGAQPNISQTIIKRTSVALPPLNEQRRIVSKIESLESRREAAQEALEAIPPLLEKFRQSVLAAAFRGDLTREWRAQNPDVESASVLLERIRTERKVRFIEDAAEKARAKAEVKARDSGKPWTDADDQEVLEKERGKAEKKYKEPEPVDATDLPELPEGWCWARLEDLTPSDAAIVYGIIQPGPEVIGGVQYIRPADIKYPGTVVEELPRTSPEIASKYHRAALKRGDLVYSIVGTIGKWFIVPEELNGANITQSSVRIRPVAPLTAEFVLRAIQSPQAHAQISKMIFGNAVQRLNVAHVRELAVPLPPTGEREQVVSLLAQALNIVSGLDVWSRDETSRLQVLTQSILAKAFRGELVPQDPNDEPASVLLERIRAERAEAGARGKPKKKAARKTTGKKNGVKASS